MKKCTVCGVNLNKMEMRDSGICTDCQKVIDTCDKDGHIPTSEELEEELKSLIKRFNEDGAFRRDILMKSNSSILRGELSLLHSLAEKKLIEMVIMSKY